MLDLPCAAIIPDAVITSDSAMDAVLHVLRGETMGTTWCVKLFASPRIDLHAMHAGIQSRLDRVVAQMSTWEPHSDICRFNRAPADSWHVLPAEFFEVLSCALAVAQASDGAYDPTVGAVVEAWGFGAAGDDHGLPDDAEISTLRATLGWALVRLEVETSRAYQAGGVNLDLSAIAKGFSVDLVASHLSRIGVKAALVEVGGELFGYGQKSGNEPWQVLVEASPDGIEADDEVPRVLMLQGKAVATSGDCWHAFEHEGIRYTHTFDPRTGRPVTHAPVAVTVVTHDCMHADAWATALTVMGSETGYEFAQARNIAARFVSRRDDAIVERMTDAFAELLPPLHE